MYDFKQFLEERVEPLARILAAEQMGITDDCYGEKLPDDIWRQKEHEARIFLGLDVADRKLAG